MADTTRLRELCDDWDLYSALGEEEDWKRKMQHTVVGEMEAELAKFRQLCRMTRPSREQSNRRQV